MAPGKTSSNVIDKWRLAGDVAAGEVVDVIGPVSSGKTLLIRLLCGEVMPSGGKVLLDGQDIHLVRAARARLGVLFEEDLLYKRLSALSNLEFYCQMRHLPRSRASEILAQVGLSDQMRKAVSKLSPSVRRRVAFARVLLSKPPVILLDRPILRTDLDTQALFARLISQAASEGAAVLLTDEDLSWAGKCCTVCGWLSWKRGVLPARTCPESTGGHPRPNGSSPPKYRLAKRTASCSTILEIFSMRRAVTVKPSCVPLRRRRLPTSPCKNWKPACR